MEVTRLEPSRYFSSRKVDVHFDNGDIAVVNPGTCTLWVSGSTISTAITTDHLIAMGPHLDAIAAHLNGAE